MTAAQRGCRVLRALGCEPRLICTLVAEVRIWQPWGALDEDDLWALAALTVWRVWAEYPTWSPAFIRTRVRWAIQHALDAERRLHGWRRPYGSAWLPPGAPLPVAA